jgi:plastocyanin
MRVTVGSLVLLALAGCLGGAAAPQESAVNIDNFAFTPTEITIAPGTTVVWTNRDDIPHTVTSADMPKLFKSAPMDTDEHFAHRFDHAGRFAYFCSLHAHMQGVVVVR